MRYSHAPAERSEALGELSLHRDARATELLLEASNAAEGEERHRALYALWLSAADGHDTTDRAVRGALERALEDPDERVAELAHEALADLDRLDEPTRRPGPAYDRLDGAAYGGLADLKP